jgi:hypothetical protein
VVVRALVATATVGTYVVHAVHTIISGPLVPAVVWNGIVGLLLAVAAALLITQKNLEEIAANYDTRTFVELSLAATRREVQAVFIATIAVLALVTIVMEWPRIAPRPEISLIALAVIVLVYAGFLASHIRSVRRASAGLRRLRAELDESVTSPSRGEVQGL